MVILLITPLKTVVIPIIFTICITVIDIGIITTMILIDCDAY